MDGPEIESRWGGGEILRTGPERAGGPNQPPIQWAPGISGE